MNLSGIDIAIVLVWLAWTLGIGIVAGLRGNFEAYWAGERSSRLLPLVLSVAATQVGAGALVGIASATAVGGIGFGLVSMFSTFVGFLLVARYSPLLKRFGDQYDAITLAQIYRVRYGRSTQLAGAAVILLCYVAILSAQFLATSGLLALSSGIDLRIAIVFATIGVVIYSSFAGLRGDIATDLWHFGGMVVGLFVFLLPATLIAHAPLDWLRRVPNEIWNPVSFGGSAFLIVGLTAGVVIPLLMPELWVKVYASQSPRKARRTMLWAAFATVPFYLLAIYLGLLGHVYYQQLENPDLLVFQQMGDLLPYGLLGVAAATFLSVILSSGNSLMLVVSATVVGDVLDKGSAWDPSLNRSRWITAVSGTAGALLALTVPDLVQLLLGAFYMLLVLAPALCGVLVWQRATTSGATASIAIGALTTLVFLSTAPKVAFLPGIIVSGVVFVFVSLLTHHSDSEDPDLINKLKDGSN